MFGPNFGGATIYTVTRKGYGAECPNVGRLLVNLKFTLRGESEMMAAILDRHEQPEAAAAEWLKAHPDAVGRWLDGVRTFDGRPARGALARGSRPALGRLRAMGARPQDPAWATPWRAAIDYRQAPRHLRVRRHLHRRSAAPSTA